MIESRVHASPSPIPLWQSLILFGVPGTLLLLGSYLIVPILVASGMPLIWAWTLIMVASITVPAIAVVLRFLKQPEIDAQAFKERFRLVPIPKKEWKWLPITFVAIAVFSFSLEWTQPLLKDLLPQQPIVPELFDDPYATVGEGNQEATFFGWPMEGNVWLIPFWIIWVLVIVASEEILWRGYALPRMEAAYGSWAFLVNGLLWNLPFHM